MKPTVFFDMDGVLADFVRGALAHHARSDFPIERVEWNFPSQIGFTGTNDPSFWQNLGLKFWSTLDILSDGFVLLREAERLVGADRIALLSSAADTHGCCDGKRIWVKKYLPDYYRRTFFGSSKGLIGGPGRVLVDDHDGNIDAWTAAGGVAVTVPRPWNERRGECLPGANFHTQTVLDELRDAIDAAACREVVKPTILSFERAREERAAK